MSTDQAQSARPQSMQADDHYREQSVKEWCARHNLPYAEYGAPVQRFCAIQPFVSQFRNNAKTGVSVSLLSYARPSIYYACVTNVTSVPRQGYLCTDDHFLLYRALGHRDYDPKSELGDACTSYDGENVFRIDLGNCKTLVEEECIFLGGNPNFGHFVFQTLARLAMLAWLPKQTFGLPVVLYDDLPARYYEFLELCGIERSRWKLIPGTSSSRFAKVWVISSPMYRPNVNPFEFFWWAESVWHVRQAIAQYVRPMGLPRPRLYIHRANAKWRCIVNNDEVLSLLVRYGFVPVELETLSAREQIELVSNAEMIVVAGGAGGAINIFAPPDCEIVELLPPIFIAEFGTVCFAAILGQSIVRIRGDFASDADAHRVRIERDFRIDCTVLEQALQGRLGFQLQLQPKAPADPQ